MPQDCPESCEGHGRSPSLELPPWLSPNIAASITGTLQDVVP